MPHFAFHLLGFEQTMIPVPFRNLTVEFPHDDVTDRHAIRVASEFPHCFEIR